MRRTILILAALLAPVPLLSQTVLVVITGIGGEARYDERFHTWAATLMDAATDRYGLPDSNVVYLAADPERDPARTTARSTKENVQATLNHLAATTPASDLVFIVVIGHGSYRNGVSKVNLPGPDMTAAEFAVALDAFGERPIVFANLSSASGEFVAILSAPDRTIITATKSGMERNQSVFGQFFVAAFVGDEADADNDERLSVLEAFSYARSEVSRAYDEDQLLLSEHAMLDDNGDGTGSAEPGLDAEDGSLAATLLLTGASTTAISGAASDDPELAGLYVDKSRLEQAIAELRRGKASIEKDEYENQLEALLVDLAMTNRAIRDREDS